MKNMEKKEISKFMSYLAKLRWKKTTKEERKEISRKMNEAKRKKMEELCEETQKMIDQV